MDGGAWWAAVHGVAQSQTHLSDFTLTFHFHALENEMATHSSVLAWRIPGGAWWSALYGVVQSRTRLKRLSSSSSLSLLPWNSDPPGFNLEKLQPFFNVKKLAAYTHLPSTFSSSGSHVPHLLVWRCFSGGHRAAQHPRHH